MVKENYTDVLHGKVNVQVGKNGFNEGLIKQIIGELTTKYQVLNGMNVIFNCQ